MKPTVLIKICLIAILFSCNEEDKKEELHCDVFDYRHGIIISSKEKINSFATIISYKNTNAIDTINVKIEPRELQMGSVYYIDLEFNTGFDYQLILNDSIKYFITDIKSGKVSYGTEFMQGRIYDCKIISYKLNNVLKLEGNLIIDFK